jgi:hypothetical protein
MVNMIKLITGAVVLALAIALVAGLAVIVSSWGQFGTVLLAAGSLVWVPVVLLVVLTLNRASHHRGTGRRTR